MINTQDITKYARHILARSKGHPDKRIMHPQREWLLIICSFFLLFIGGALYAWQQFVHFTNLPDTVEVSGDMDVPEYRATMIEEVHAIYGERREAFDAIMGAVPDTPVATTTLDTVNEEQIATTTDASADLEVSGGADEGIGTTTDAEVLDDESMEPIDLDAL